MCNHALRSVPFFIFVVVFLLTPFAYADHRVNINTADKETLTTLTGIGDVKAQSIIDYRTQYGNFQIIDDIKNVSGIGESTFNNIQDHITVDASATTTPPPTETASSAPSSSPQDVAVDTKNISAEAGSDRTVFAGADALFEGEAFGLQGEPLEMARYIWTFGNGDRREGKTFFYNFPYPGTYVVVLDVVSGKYSATDRMKVEVIPAQLTIGEVTKDFIEIANHSDVEIDLGGWMILANNQYFRFPLHTIVLAGEVVRISNVRTGLTSSSAKDVSILYPNGTPAVVYEEPLVVSRAPVTKSSNAPSREASVVETNTNSSQAVADAPPENPSNATQRALPPTLPSGTQGSVLPWILGVFAIAGSAIVGVFFVRRKRYSEYEIQEIE